MPRLDASIMDFLLDLQYKKVIYLSNNDEALFYGKQIFDILKEKIVITDPNDLQVHQKDSICQILEKAQVCSEAEQKQCKDTTDCNKGF